MNSLLNIKPHVVTSSPLDKIFLFYGEPGTRKTTVAVGDVERTLLFAFEIGYKFIPNVLAKPVSKWHEFKHQLTLLEDPAVKEKFKSIAIDTIGLAYKACVSYICASHGVTELSKIPWGQGWAMAKNEFERTINSIPQMGYGLTMIAHSDESIDEEVGSVTAKVDIDKRPSSVIKGLADFILYARKEPSDEDETVQTVYAYSSTTANVEVKSRARFFPKRFEFTYENLIKALDHAIKEQDKFFNTKSSEAPDFSMYEHANKDEIDLEELKTEVTNLGKELMETYLADRVADLMADLLKGIRVSETTRNHIPALYTLKDKMLELKKGL